MIENIKLRGVNPISGEVLRVCDISWEHNEVYFDRDSDTPHPISACKLMQYTGIKDKNGVEACGGDWVIPASGKFVTGCIVWWKGAFWVSGKNKRGSSGRDLLAYYPEFTIETNIHQTPELLNE